MKLNRYIFIASSIVLFTTLFIILNSCEYFVKNETTETKQTESNDIISKQQSEAKLLVLASEYNLDVIELCNIIEEEKVDENVKTLIEHIKERQLAIHEKYKEIALENVISIPRYSNLEKQEIQKLTDASGLENHLKLLTAKMHDQKILLDKLSDTTSNPVIKTLADTANSTLTESLDKTKETLKIINTNS